MLVQLFAPSLIPYGYHLCRLINKLYCRITHTSRPSFSPAFGVSQFRFAKDLVTCFTGCAYCFGRMLILTQNRMTGRKQGMVVINFAKAAAVKLPPTDLGHAQLELGTNFYVSL